jgi:hypothetical protein
VFFVLFLNLLAKGDSTLNDEIPLVKESSIFGLKKKKLN